MAKASKQRAAQRAYEASAGAKRARPQTWSKDEEEMDLEQKLFGTSKAAPAASTSRVEDIVDDAMGGLDDADLFEIDAPVMDDLPSEEEDEEEEEEDDEEDNEDDEEEDSQDISDDESDASDSSFASSSTSVSMPFDDRDATSEAGPSSVFEKPKPKRAGSEPVVELPDDLQDSMPSRSKKSKGVWTDPSDEIITVNLDSNRRTKKLARGKGDPQVSGVEFEKRLRAQFESLHPRPDWASNRSVTGTPSMKLLLSSTKSFIAAESHAPLPSGKLELRRLLDANHQNPTTNRRTAQGAGKGVVDVAWHPNPRVGVMAVSGGDRRVRFFNIDGHTNSTLLTIHLPSLPLTKSTFHPSGSTLLLAGTRPYYYTYDLPSARCIRSARNLFGSTPDATAPNSLTRHAFSPDGSMLAVAGRRGAVSILDWSGVGVGAVIADLRTGRGGSVAAMTWSRDSRELSVLGGRDGAEVEVWNVGEKKIVRKWRDDRAFGGTTMDTSADGGYTAIGSSTGIVNLYSTSSLSTAVNDASTHILPTPLRSLEHLTTQIVSTAFHPESEILLTASNAKKAQLKAYHLPSATAFANWPTPTTPLGRVAHVSFSPGGEYMAAGSERGRVLLYNVSHYA